MRRGGGWWLGTLPTLLRRAAKLEGRAPLLSLLSLLSLHSLLSLLSVPVL